MARKAILHERAIYVPLDVDDLEIHYLLKCFGELRELAERAEKRGHNRLHAATELATSHLHTLSLYHSGFVYLDGIRYAVKKSYEGRWTVACEDGYYIVVGFTEAPPCVLLDGRRLDDRDEQVTTIREVVAEFGRVAALHTNAC